MSTDLLVILDDNSDGFSYAEVNTDFWISWGGSGVRGFYGETVHIPYGTLGNAFTFAFQGTSAAFFGYTRAPPEPQTATVQIDNGTSFGITVGDPDAITYKQWFITPTLPDGDHRITVSSLYNLSVDYAIVQVGSRTSLTGKTVIVDDDSPLVHYYGQWSRNMNKSLPTTRYPGGYPYRNSTHRSSNAGDSFTFQFSGTSIGVYGVLSWFNLGYFSAIYSIDGTRYRSSISITPLSPGYLANDGELLNYLYFSLDSLPSGTHTLLVNITEAINQTLTLDYITYRPSFDTLSSMPSLSSDVSSTTSSGTSHLSSETSSSSTARGSPQLISTGAIIGSVIGGSAFSIMVTTLVVLFILRRRRPREQRYAYPDAALRSGLNDPNMLNPYRSSSSQMHDHVSPLRRQAPFNAP